MLTLHHQAVDEPRRRLRRDKVDDLLVLVCAVSVAALSHASRAFPHTLAGDGVVVVRFEALFLVQTLDPVEPMGVSTRHANPNSLCGLP